MDDSGGHPCPRCGFTKTAGVFGLVNTSGSWDGIFTEFWAAQDGRFERSARRRGRPGGRRWRFIWWTGPDRNDNYVIFRHLVDNGHGAEAMFDTDTREYVILTDFDLDHERVSA